MEGFAILNSEKAESIAEKPTMPRRKLADISNLMEKPRPSIQKEKLQSMASLTKERIDQLQKENMALLQMLAHRDIIIEQSGVELQRLRVDLLKMQEQNKQLALSNNQMLTELNFGRDMVKALQHELGCKNGLLNARKLELEERARSTSCENATVEILDVHISILSLNFTIVCLNLLMVKFIQCEKPGELSKEGGEDEHVSNAKRISESAGSCCSKQLQIMDKAEKNRSCIRRQSASQNADIEVNLIKLRKPEQSPKGGNNEIPSNTERISQSNSLGFSDLFKSMDKAENKRSYVRRQSASFKAEEVKPTDNLSKTDDGTSPGCPLPHDPVKENSSASTNVLLENDRKNTSLAHGNEAPEVGRLSLCRPSRQAAKKVVSYKEIPINVKMRRP